jgi:hypothetical protein
MSLANIVGAALITASQLVSTGPDTLDNKPECRHLVAADPVVRATEPAMETLQPLYWARQRGYEFNASHADSDRDGCVSIEEARRYSDKHGEGVEQLLKRSGISNPQYVSVSNGEIYAISEAAKARMRGEIEGLIRAHAVYFGEFDGDEVARTVFALNDLDVDYAIPQ